jgi:CubicO group peptidase (beta-lactamase class C family)
MPTEAASRVLRSAVNARVFPCAVAEVGSGAEPIWQDTTGTLMFGEPADVTAQTLYDLASLTKVIATTTVAMDLVARAAVTVDDRISDAFAEWTGSDRERAIVRDLMEHASGLSARLLDPPPATAREFIHEICSIPLEYPVRSRSVYSDLGFILLGFLLEQRGGGSLAVQFGRIWPRPDLTFELDRVLRRKSAPTRPMDEDPRRGRVLVGEVHDNYAAALGGVAGHAGLFGTVGAVGDFARTVLRAARGESSGASERAPFSQARVKEFVTRSSVPGSSRALGWDTMLPTSSCGTRMSASAFGHVGFTGTSLWIDPDRDRYFVLLTNRVCGGGSVDAMRDVRRAFHDALGDV